MNKEYSRKSDLYDDFFICVKFQFSFDLIPILEEVGWIQETSLGDIEEDIIHREDYYLGRGAVMKSPEGDDIAVLAHETGPETWIIPIAKYVAGAITAGVLGNAAYDLIRKLISSVDYSHRDTMVKIRTPEYETIDLSRLSVIRQQEIIEGVISHRIRQLGLVSGDKDRPSLQVLNERIDILEDQLRTIAVKYLEISTEFQKERTRWRNQLGNLHQRIADLEKSDSVICQVVIEEEIKATKNEKQAQKTERACSAR